MSIKRYNVVQAVKTTNNELIPIWDERIVFEKTKDYGNRIMINGRRDETSYDLIDCVYDLKTKELKAGIELDYYPSDDDLKFKITESVLFKKSNLGLLETMIVDVVYEEYELEIRSGRKIDKYWIKHFNNIDFISDYIYAIKIWKPFYILDDGTKVKWEHELFKKYVETENQ